MEKREYIKRLIALRKRFPNGKAPEITIAMRQELYELYSMRRNFSDNRGMMEWIGVHESHVSSMRRAEQDKRDRSRKIERESAAADAKKLEDSI